MQLKKYNKKSFYIFLLMVLILPFSFSHFSNAQSVDDLENQIDQYSEKIKKLDEEIKESQEKLQEKSKEAKTLQNTVNSLDLTEKKISTDIQKTQTNIQKTATTIEKLAIEIDDKQQKIERNERLLAETVRRINKAEATSLLEIIFIYEDFSDLWNAINDMNRFKNTVREITLDLQDLSVELEEKQNLTAEEREQLEQFKNELAGEREVVQYTKKEKSVLLSRTKSEEAEYQKLLAEKLAQKKAFEQELFNIESQLKLIVEPGSYAEAGFGTFGWPVSGFIITQYFGGTQFAKSNPQFYANGNHNGVDLAVPLGTPVVAAMDGVVRGVGNTDNFPGCRSWGGWVLVEHPNGLSTMHAHLSSAIVTEGQSVKKGQTIAYSGTTGISTGPHLHFTVYISEGVKVQYYKDVSPSSSGCGATNARIPIASLDAYLDPMLYLPKL